MCSGKCNDVRQEYALFIFRVHEQVKKGMRKKQVVNV
jgi:hypothetical protein